MAHRALKVFVSSTSRDLQDYRAVARNVILEMDWMPKMMEFFGALSEPTVSACQSVLEQCDVVLLWSVSNVVGTHELAQGGDGGSSITALELAAARQRGIPVLAMLASEKWPQNLCERDQAARDWVEKFRGELNLPAEFFDYEDPVGEEARRLSAFRTKVRSVLLAHRERMADIEAHLAPGDPDYFESAQGLLAEGNCIPFLGPSVYGDGPLSTQALVSALWSEVPTNQACLATAAEYAERVKPSREIFLQTFERILVEQARHVRPPAMHDMVARLTLRDPPILVSLCHDMVLEQRLAADRTCGVVAHIIRSWQGEHDGKLLLLASGRPPEICLADKLDLDGLDLIVYKPLGSPLLHRELDPELEIDTVVATEADHLTFLGRLANQHTRVPSAFHRPFQRRPVLFLGLQLDYWQHRLVLQVFRSVNLGGGRARSLAVRMPGSPMEKLAWQNLHADTIQVDPNAFAGRVLSGLSGQTEAARE